MITKGANYISLILHKVYLRMLNKIAIRSKWSHNSTFVDNVKHFVERIY